VGQICGLEWYGYILALQALQRQVNSGV